MHTWSSDCLEYFYNLHMSFKIVKVTSAWPDLSSLSVKMKNIKGWGDRVNNWFIHHNTSGMVGHISPKALAALSVIRNRDETIGDSADSQLGSCGDWSDIVKFFSFFKTFIRVFILDILFVCSLCKPKRHAPSATAIVTLCIRGRYTAKDHEVWTAHEK